MRLERKARELMFAAEKSICKGRYNISSWSSKTLTTIASHYMQLKKEKRKMISSNEYTQTDINECDIKVQKALTTLRNSQDSSLQLRQQQQNDIAKLKSKKWKVRQEQALKIIQNAEKSSQTFTKLYFFLKPKATSSLKHVLIPADSELQENTIPVIGTSKQWKEIHSEEEVFNITLLQNAYSLMWSKDSVASTGVFSEQLGYGAENESFIQSLFNGTVDSKSLSKQYPQVQAELEEFLTQCQKSEDMKDFKWNFGVEEYKNLFDKTRSTTSCGPSGLHMQHWKAATMDDDLAYINAFFIHAAFKLNFVYDRWLISWHCMLLKKKDPFYNKLRIIQLFEGDFNGALKYLLG